MSKIKTVLPSLSPEQLWFGTLFNLTVQASLLSWHQLRPNLFALFLLLIWNLFALAYFTLALEHHFRDLKIKGLNLWCLRILGQTPYIGAALVILLMMRRRFRHHPNYWKGIYLALGLLLFVGIPYWQYSKNRSLEGTNPLFPFWISAGKQFFIMQSPHLLSYAYLASLEWNHITAATPIHQVHTAIGYHKLYREKSAHHPHYAQQLRSYLQHQIPWQWPWPMGMSLIKGSVGQSLHLFAMYLFTNSIDRSTAIPFENSDSAKGTTHQTPLYQVPFAH